VESQDSLADNYEVLPIRRCTVSTWFNGQRSSLALDSAGNPRIAYDAQYGWYGTEKVNGGLHACNYNAPVLTAYHTAALIQKTLVKPWSDRGQTTFFERAPQPRRRKLNPV